MAAETQISVKIDSDYSPDYSEDLISVDTEESAVEITLGTPEENISFILQDLGFASTNNITLTSTQLINGSSGLTIDEDYSAIQITYKPLEGYFIAKTLVGYRNISSESTLTSEDKTVFVDSTSAAFTVYLNPEPEVGDVVEILDKAANCGTNNITIDGNGFTIVGEDDALMNMDYIVYTLKFNGSFWNISSLT